MLSSFFYKFADTILKKYSSTIATVFTALMSYVLFAHELTVNFFIGVAIVFISMHQFFTFGEQVSVRARGAQRRAAVHAGEEMRACTMRRRNRLGRWPQKTNHRHPGCDGLLCIWRRTPQQAMCRQLTRCMPALGMKRRCSAHDVVFAPGHASDAPPMHLATHAHAPWPHSVIRSFMAGWLTAAACPRLPCMQKNKSKPKMLYSPSLEHVTTALGPGGTYGQQYNGQSYGALSPKSQKAQMV